MLTLSDDRAERNARIALKQKLQDEQRRKTRVWLQDIENKTIPIHAPEFLAIREGLRQQVRLPSLSYRRIGILCNYCGTELINQRPGEILLSYPPRIEIGCIGCGWIGSKQTF